MYSINSPIVSGHSIGGISLGSNPNIVSTKLQNDGLDISVESFENFGTKFSCWKIKEWGLSYTTDHTNTIYKITCDSCYRGGYEGRLYSGMTVQEIVENSNKQLIIHGMIVLDAEYGIFFEIPEFYNGKQYDDVDSVAELPATMILENIHVMNKNWWR